MAGKKNRGRNDKSNTVSTEAECYKAARMHVRGDARSLPAGCSTKCFQNSPCEYRKGFAALVHYMRANAGKKEKALYQANHALQGQILFIAICPGQNFLLPPVQSLVGSAKCNGQKFLLILGETFLTSFEFNSS